MALQQLSLARCGHILEHLLDDIFAQFVVSVHRKNDLANLAITHLHLGKEDSAVLCSPPVNHGEFLWSFTTDSKDLGSSPEGSRWAAILIPRLVGREGTLKVLQVHHCMNLFIEQYNYGIHNINVVQWLELPYSGIFSLVQNFMELPPSPSEEILWFLILR